MRKDNDNRPSTAMNFEISVDIGSVYRQILYVILSDSSSLTFFPIFSDLGPVLELIFKYLDATSLRAAEQVCRRWFNCIVLNKVWRNKIKEKVSHDSVWNGIGKRRGWIHWLNTFSDDFDFDHEHFRALYSKTEDEIEVFYYELKVYLI